jgi:hypothetical protein
MGELIPVCLTETLMGDDHMQHSSVLLRAMPTLAPTMHPVEVKMHHFFVPYRLIWEDWEDFITGGEDGNDASVYPTVTTDGTSGAVGELLDYLGVPPGTGYEVSALPARAYNLIWNEFYRDQQLETELVIDLTSGPDTTTSLVLQNAPWQRDYFTTCRPSTQLGTAVSLPLGTSAPVRGLGADPSATYPSSSVSVRESDASSDTYANAFWTDASSPNRLAVEEDPDNSGYPRILADLQDATGASVIDFRLSLALQRYQEARNNYGARYDEYLRYYGVRAGDGRLQRPEYLGGGKQTIQWSEVLQTTPDSGSSTFVGTLRGHGISATRTRKFRRHIPEHGVIMSLMSVLPKTMYPQGVHRMFTRTTKEDFFQKELEGIGKQEVYNKELYFAHTNPDNVFGYQDRYDEYRRTQSRVSGEMRDTTYDYWHMARIFASDPSLNADFVKSNPTERIFAASTNDTLLAMTNHTIHSRRFVSKRARTFTK